MGMLIHIYDPDKSNTEMLKDLKNVFYLHFYQAYRFRF